MRLTLRTLLAFRDRVLNANELEDMHRRVQQSAMAGNLIKRLDSLDKRATILAPPIEGKGLGADANSIAEYLDDTLQRDKVPELERICLESDVQLAELAQCHRILSAALSTSVEVPEPLRQRVIALSSESVRAQAIARRRNESGVPLSETPPSVPATNNDRATDGAHTKFRADAAHVTEPAITIANGRPGKSRELVQAHAVTAPMVASGGDSIKPTGLDLEGSHLAHEVPEYLRGKSRDGWLGPLAIGALICVLCLLVWQSIGSWSSVREMFTLAPEPSTEPSELSDDNKHIQPNGNQAVPAPNSNEAGQPTEPNNRLENNAASVDKPPRDQAPPVAPIAGVDERPSIAVPTVARWLPADANSRNSVLLLQVGQENLKQLQPADELLSGCQLFVPPANRPALDFMGGPRWQVCGITYALLIKPEAGPGDCQVDLRLGRAIVTGSVSGQSLVLVTPAGTIRITVANSASAAVELSYVPKGHGAINNPSVCVPTLTIVSLEGDATIQAGRQNLICPAGNRVTIQAGQLTQPEAADAPQWVDLTSERAVDLSAAADLAKELTGQTALGETLQAMSTHRRPETRALAAQTLALLGNWDWVAKPNASLSNPKDRVHWTTLIDRTRQILAAHQSNSETLLRKLEEVDPKTAAWRHQLWLGLDANQLKTEGVQALLASLESDALIERVLAHQQLQRATGKDLGYQPSEPNRTLVSQIARELASGKISILPVPRS